MAGNCSRHTKGTPATEKAVELYSSIVAFAVYGETRGIQCETSKHVKNYMGSYHWVRAAVLILTK